MRFVRTLTLVIAAVLTVAPSLETHAEVTHLSESDRSVLEHPDAFTQVNRVGGIPKSVIRAIADASHDPEFRLADPGQEWQETDVIVEPRLSRRRLVFAASTPEYWLIHYELGGYSHSYHLVLVEGNPGSEKVVWRATMFEMVASMREIPSLLASKELSDNPADGF